MFSTLSQPMLGYYFINATTKIDAVSVSHTWTIDKFCFDRIVNGHYLRSPTIFIPFNVHSYGCEIRLYLDKCTRTSEEYISLDLYLQVEFNDYFQIEWELCILDIAGGKKNIQNGLNLFRQPCYYQKLCNFIKIKDFVEDTTISLQMTLGFLDSGIETHVPDCLSEADEELGSLLENKEMTDITLMDKNGHELYAHKAILAARSPVFMAMLKSDMKEKNENKIKLHDFSRNEIKEMLQFMYTGRVENFDQHYSMLLKAADMYQIDRLKDMCERMLYVKLSFENVVEFLILADTYQCDTLRGQIESFIIDHKNDVINRPEWKDLKNSHPPIVIDILCKMVE